MTILQKKMKIQWNNYCADMILTNQIKIPRWTFFSDDIRVELHGFSDASELAYGACVYLRCFDLSGTIYSTLICAKSKIAPLKIQTIPRLELSAALLLTQLVTKVKSGLKFDKIKTICWSDSTIVLTWLQVDPCRLLPFAKNRIMSINEINLSCSWKYVNSTENPADIISRGCSPSQLLNSSLWWHGPNFLSSNEIPMFPCELPDSSEGCLKEFKTETISSAAEIQEEFSLFTRISSGTKMIRVLAYMLRFADNCRKKKKPSHDTNLSVEELSNSENICAKIVQRKAYADEIEDLKNKRGVKRSSPLLRLHPFLKNDVIRVGGRLNRSDVDVDQRNPIVLPFDHLFTKAYARSAHEKHGHCGPQMLLCLIRLKYWPINGGKLTSILSKKCVKCVKAKPKIEEQLMGDLPKNRVTPNRPFLKVGIDFAGPVKVKTSIIRNAKIVKSYVAVFVCFSTKAAHLELVSDLTTDAFMASLKRFIARRGLCSTIHSDNGSNFVGANNELLEIYDWFSADATQNSIKNAVSLMNIDWKFNIPYAPHRGGLWEAAVKSMKFHLYRIVGNVPLTFEKIYTVLTQIEAILNSRPLTPLSSDPNDFMALTPAHFLIGQPMLEIPEYDLQKEKSNRLSQWQQLSQLKQHFWSRWSKEYLPLLQQRVKWQESKFQMKENDLVIIQDDNKKSLDWPLGRIIKINFSKDNVARSAIIRTANGITERVVQRLCVLPVD